MSLTRRNKRLRLPEEKLAGGIAPEKGIAGGTAPEGSRCRKAWEA